MPPVEPLPPRQPDEPDPTETIEVPTLDKGRDTGAAGSYALIVASGPQRGLHWAIGEGVQAGRNPEAEIFLDDVTVSRHHAEFTVEGDALVVRDLGSTNGTYVNGERCDESVLAVGDHVIIGRFHLIVAADS
jgi:pSer/pThr/pTyr-binding forkhead associated (FHA) protein